LKNNINGTFHQYQGFDAHCFNKLIPDQLNVRVKIICGVVLEKQKTDKIFVLKKLLKYENSTQLRQ